MSDFKLEIHSLDLPERLKKSSLACACAFFVNKKNNFALQAKDTLGAFCSKDILYIEVEKMLLQLIASDDYKSIKSLAQMGLQLPSSKVYVLNAKSNFMMKALYDANICFEKIVFSDTDKPRLSPDVLDFLSFQGIIV
jgi:hypothetical protein